MALGTSYIIALWKRWCREVSTVENGGRHTAQVCRQTICIRRGNVNDIFCELQHFFFFSFLVVIK